jgi:hypothetical protein
VFEPLSRKELVLVTGARALEDTEGSRAALWEQISKDLTSLPNDTLLLHGGAVGPDTRAEQVAQRRKDYVRGKWNPTPMPFVRYALDGNKYSSSGGVRRWAMGSFTPFDRNERLVHRALWLWKDGWRVHVFAYFAPWAETFGTRHCFELSQHLGMTAEAGVDVRTWSCSPDFSPRTAEPSQ